MKKDTKKRICILFIIIGLIGAPLFVFIRVLDFYNIFESKEINQDEVTSSSAVSSGAIVGSEDKEFEALNLVGLPWGIDSDSAYKQLKSDGFIVTPLSDNGYYINFYAGLLGKEWDGRLEFNDDNQLFGCSLNLSRLITTKEEYEESLRNTIDAFYNRYGNPVSEENTKTEDLVNKIKESVDNDYIAPIQFRKNGVLSVITSMKIDKLREDLYKFYGIANIQPEQLKSLEDGKEYYMIYLAFLSERHPSDQIKLTQPSLSDNYDIEEAESNFEALKFYTDSDENKIILNPESYKDFDKNVNLDEYYIEVNWETDKKTSEGIYLIKAGEMKRIIDSGEKTIDDFIQPVEDEE